jgi:hypothetical protein
MGRLAIVAAVSAVLSLMGGAFVYGQQRTSHKLTFDDYLEIQQLYATYAHTIDSGEDQGRAWANTFTPDGVFIANGQTNGTNRAELAAFIKAVHDDPTYHNRHWMANLRLTPTAEGVTGSVYVLVLRGSSGSTAPG